MLVRAKALVRVGLLALCATGCALWPGFSAAQSFSPSSGVSADAFQLELFKTRFEHEMAFRAAAIQVAWGAESLCDDTTEIEPFVLWSVHALRRGMSNADKALLMRATGMDEKWRVAWADEGAPDELKLGDVVVAVNGRALPGSSSRMDMAALLRGSSPISGDDQGFWDVMLKAREEARNGQPMMLTLEGGRKLKVDTQSGCAGSVVATAFDNEPELFWRAGSQRAKIPGNALLLAKHRDEFRWLAAFGTYFQASEAAIGKARTAENASNAFVIGKILTLAVPGAGMLLSAVEAQAEKSIAVDGLVGNADLFANEVVVALGGEPEAGLRLSERMQQEGVKADVLVMDAFRLSNAKLHAERLRKLQALQAPVPSPAVPVGSKTP